MKTRIKTPGRWALGVAALVCAAGAAGAQGPCFYSGRGFVRPIEEAGPVGSVAFGDFQGDGHLDLASCRAGTLTIFDRFGDYDAPHEIEDVDFCAVTRHGPDLIWTISASSLHTIEWPGDSLDCPSPEPVDLPLNPSIGVFRAQERPDLSALLIIDVGGARARFVKVIDGEIAAVFTRLATTFEEGGFLDLALVDWDGDGNDDYATYSDEGLRVVNAALEPLAFYPGLAAGAFLDVLPGGSTQHGDDLLLCQRRESLGDTLDLLVLNADHEEELLDVAALGMKRVFCADFTDDPWCEVILPLSDRLAGILVQVETSKPSEPVLSINYGNVNLIDLVLELPPMLTPSPPAVAVADVDYDGDDDLLFADDRGLGMVVASTRDPLGNLRVQHNQLPLPTFPSPGASPKFKLSVLLDVPAGTDSVQVELWRQPSLGADAVYVGTCPLAITGPGQAAGLINMAVPSPSNPPVEIYQVLFRAVDGESPRPVRVDLFSPHGPTVSMLYSGTYTVYPWLPGVDEGGTVQRPHISPGGGTGPH